MNLKRSLSNTLATGVMAASLLTSSLVMADGHYTVNGELSQVSFATIKKQYVVEPATIGKLSGHVKGGKAVINVPLSEISTGIQIRDMRLNDIFFQSGSFPELKISADLGDMDLSSPKIVRKDVTFTLEMYGVKKELSSTVLVSSTGTQVLVTSIKPLVISSGDFGIPADNLTNLAKTVGGIAISGNVPVNFAVTLDKS